MKPLTNEELVDRYHQIQEALGGCGDGWCVIKKPKGQHTNGGCNCLTHPDRLTLNRVGHLLRLSQELLNRLEIKEE